MSWKIIVAVVFVLILLVSGAFIYGAYRWQADTKALQTRIKTARVALSTKTFQLSDLQGLPEPVQRYFQTVLKEGQPLITKVTVEHSGTFNMGKHNDQWKPFKSRQLIITKRPGFVWDARIRMAPAMTVHVHDAYIAGKGILTARLFGFLTVMEQPDSPQLAQGEFVRFCAEAAWYPTVLLPGQGVRWQAIDKSSAGATITDGPNTVQLVFRFDDRGLISSVRCDERYREVNGRLVATSWQGRFWKYETHDGMLIPVKGEVAWLLPEGEKPYWRGHIQKIEYEFAR